jgi:hypothetical protein
LLVGALPSVGAASLLYISFLSRQSLYLTHLKRTVFPPKERRAKTNTQAMKMSGFNFPTMLHFLSFLSFVSLPHLEAEIEGGKKPRKMCWDPKKKRKTNQNHGLTD